MNSDDERKCQQPDESSAIPLNLDDCESPKPIVANAGFGAPPDTPAVEPSWDDVDVDLAPIPKHRRRRREATEVFPFPTILSIVLWVWTVYGVLSIVGGILMSATLMTFGKGPDAGVAVLIVSGSLFAVGVGGLLVWSANCLRSASFNGIVPTAVFSLVWGILSIVVGAAAPRKEADLGGVVILIGLVLVGAGIFALKQRGEYHDWRADVLDWRQRKR